MGLGGKTLHSPVYPAGSRSSSISRYGSGHAHAGEGWGVAARCNWSSWCALSCRTRPGIGHWRSCPRRALCPRVLKPRPPQTLSVAFANYTGANGLDQTGCSRGERGRRVAAVTHARGAESLGGQSAPCPAPPGAGPRWSASSHYSGLRGCSPGA